MCYAQTHAPANTSARTHTHTHIYLHGGHCIIFTAVVTKRSVISDAIIIFLTGEAEEPRFVCFAESKSGDGTRGYYTQPIGANTVT